VFVVVTVVMMKAVVDLVVAYAEQAGEVGSPARPPLDSPGARQTT